MKYVLIIEDDQFLADAYRAKFRNVKDMRVDLACDGNEALTKIKQQRPDAIILDLLMPNLDGFGLLIKLRDDKLDIPVLVVSNMDTDEDIKKAMDLGAKDYFIKSNTPIQDIVQKVTDLMKEDL